MPSETARTRDMTPVDGPDKVIWIERAVVLLLFAGLMIGVFDVLKPFGTAILFGATLATAAWPLRQFLIRRISLSRGTAATILLLLSIALVALPVLLIAPHLSDQLTQGMRWSQAYFATAPEPPSWLIALPIVGSKLGAAWNSLVEVEGDLLALGNHYATGFERILVVVAQALADSVVQLILSLAVATTLWISGESVVGALHFALKRLGGAVADQVIDVAAHAVRGVAYGVVGTAAIQAIMLAIGLVVAGVPSAAMLGFIALIIAISQIGAPLLILIWGGAAWWLFGQQHQILAVLMVTWGILVSTIDNFIKPWLIGQGIRMPLSLTVLGVFGGFVAFGFLGLFIGPTLIAVMFHLLQAWQGSALSE